MQIFFRCHCFLTDLVSGFIFLDGDRYQFKRTSRAYYFGSGILEIFVKMVFANFNF